MTLLRIGSGFDAHQLADRSESTLPVVLCGVVVDAGRSVIATSDGDVAVHAVIDALLGAAALGDIGTHFSPHDPQWQDASSLAMLETVIGMLATAGWSPHNIDVTVIAQLVRVAPHRMPMREALAKACGLALASVSVKATTTDAMGFVGRSEGIAAQAVCTVVPT